MRPEKLIHLADAAVAARRMAYAPYSGFAVGAAVATADGQLFTGCNVENASYGGCLCAERVAAAAAVAAGHRHWQALAIALPGGGTPCGICRQFLSEFAEDLLILAIDTDRPTAPPHRYQLQQLYPHGFSGRDLQAGPPKPPTP